MRRIASWLAVVLALVLAVGACGQEKVDLKLVLRQGQSFRVALATSNASNTTLGGRPAGTTESLKLCLAFTVLEVNPNGTYKLRAVFEKPNYSLAGAGQAKLDFISGILSKAFAAIDGQGFEFELDRSGIVLNISGLESAAQGAASAIDSCPEPGKSYVSACFGQMVSDASWRQTLSSLFTLLPDAPVAVGERWSRKLSVSSEGLTAQTEAYYKITEGANGIAKIKVHHDIKSLDRSLSIGIKYKLSGTAEGVVEIEESTGLILRGNVKSSLKGNASAADGNGGKTVPLVMVGTVSFSRQ